MDELLTVQQIAKELDLSEHRVREFFREGRLGMKIGRQWLATRAELEEFKKLPRKHGAPRKDDDDDAC